VLAASGTGTWRWDMSSGVVEWDETLEALSGLRPGTFGSTYEAWVATLHPDEVESILELVNDAIERRGSYHFEHRAMWPDGSEHWLECRGQVTTDADGTATGTVGCAVDITDRRVADDLRDIAFQRERRLRDRFEFLVGLNDIAAAAHTHVEFLAAAARAAVPKLGDWCSIHFRPERGSALQTEVVHADPDLARSADRLAERFPYGSKGRGITAVMATGRTEFLPRVSDRVIEGVLEADDDRSDEVREILDALGVASVITVPLRTGRGVIGAMQFVNSEPGRVFDPDDVALAGMTASRVADALDNLWLTEQHRHISATLQRALLPPKLPEIPGVEVAVRYWPAGAAVAAGGDFYDVFRTADRTWSLLIGDVCGTGPDAAALTGITRHTARAAARHGQEHCVVLEWLNEAMRLSNRDLFCTAVYATLDGSAGAWSLTSCAAGHPLPILIRPGCPAATIGSHGTLIGVLSELDLHPTEVALEVGDTVVFYTDGLTDLRPPHGRTEAEFVALVEDLADGRSASQLSEDLHSAVTSRLTIEDQVDDVAVVVVRVVAQPAPT